MFLNLLGLFAVLAVCGLGFSIGGRDERLASSGFVLAMAVTRLFTSAKYTHTETAVLMIDSMLLIGLVVLALRSDRFWPMWAAAFQLVGTTVHFASMAETGDYKWAYAVGLIFWSYPVLIALGVGTWLEGRHRRSQALA
jgi:hypothetical protein